MNKISDSIVSIWKEVDWTSNDVIKYIKPFISPLALPGDNIQLNDFKAFYFNGSQGLYIHPNIWHEGVFPTKERATFRGKQGKVHARVSIDLLKEFKSYIYFKTST